MNKQIIYMFVLICATIIVSATLLEEGSVDDGRDVTFWNCSDLPHEADALGLNQFDCAMYNSMIDLRIFSRDVEEGFNNLQPKFAEWDDDKTGGCSFDEYDFWALTTGNRTHAKMFDTTLSYFNIVFATKSELEQVNKRLDRIEAYLSLEPLASEFDLCLKTAQIRADRTNKVQWCDGYKVMPGSKMWVKLG